MPPELGWTSYANRSSSTPTPEALTPVPGRQVGDNKWTSKALAVLEDMDAGLGADLPDEEDALGMEQTDAPDDTPPSKRRRGPVSRCQACSGAF